MSLFSANKNSFMQIQFAKFAESLQVSGNFPIISLCMPEKRVLPFAFSVSGREASLTVEAALSLSLFLLMAAALMQPMVWLDRQRKVQTVTEVFCGELSQYAYIERNLKGAAARLRLLGQVRSAAGDVRSLRIQNAHVPDENGMICFELEYREKVPFFSAIGMEITMTAAARKRAWIGLDGKLDGSGKNPWEDEEQDIIVYVGASMGRYHWDRDCHYISNQYESVSADRISELRNSSGRKYKACSSCGRGGISVGRLYITPGGEHYHTVSDCRAMVFYVQAVPLREVAHLGPCSYCTRKRGNRA